VRYIVYGAGAIGGTIGALLRRAERDVTLIARGAHLEALRRDGLTLEAPDGDVTLEIPAVGSPAEAEVGAGDVVLLSMKTQDTAAALDELAAVCDPGVAVVCAQNGVENERLALRRFAHVYAMYVFSPTEHIEPGVVRIYSAAPRGILDLGRVPSGADPRARQIAADLTAAGYESRALEEPMRWKYSKLLDNLGNSLQALCGADADVSDLDHRAREEGLRCYEAAGIDCASPEERSERTGVLHIEPVHGERHRGGSSWQSLVRGTGSIEAAYLNGEIALLGRLHGVATPANDTFQLLALRAAREGAQPGSVTVEELAAAVDQRR
jgi:2-dehydropantoate 2-reductase